MDALDGKAAGRDGTRKAARVNGLAHSDRMVPGGPADG
jgi:hypothetical protein